MIPRAPGRPVDLDKQRAIVAAAWDLFLARGVDAVPVEAIARRAGVSKVTLYRHFPDKDALLDAAVTAEMERIGAAQGAPSHPAAGADAAAADVGERLRRFGSGIMHFLAEPNAVAFYATLAGELSRRPELARRFWDAGPGRTRSGLIALLADAHGRGEIHIDDVELAADQLFGLWQGFTNLQYSLGRPDTVGIRRRVDAGVALFLAGHPPRAAYLP